MFTAAAWAVFGMRTSERVYGPTPVQFLDQLNHVTQLFSTGPSTILAIAGSTLVLYEYNDTDVWRAAWYTDDYLVFDVQHQRGRGVSSIGPLIVNGLVVLGSRNVGLKPSSAPWSTVFAFNATTLDLVWNTTIGWDTTSFAPASCWGDAFVYILAQNTKRGITTLRVLKLRLDNGKIIGTPLVTAMSYFTVIGVMNTQLVVASKLYIDIYDTVTWTKLRSTISTDYADWMLYQPAVINNTWYVVQNDLLYAFDNTTSEQLPWSPYQFEGNVRGATLRYFSDPLFKPQMTVSPLLLMEDCRVWTVLAVCDARRPIRERRVCLLH